MRYISRITTSLTLSEGEEFILNHGNEYDLPEDNAHIQSLEAQGLLFRVPGQAPFVAEAPKETKAAAPRKPAAPKAPKEPKAPKAEKPKPTAKAAAENKSNSNPQ